MIVVAAYQTEYDKDEQVSYVQAVETLNCPFCDCSELIKKGWRKRKLFMLIGTFMILMIRRVKCKTCGKIHHVLPNTIVPYKRYDAETIKKIIEGNSSEICCEECTANRIKAWWADMRLYILIVAPLIMKKHKIRIKPELNLTQAVLTLANTHLWPGTRSALEPG